MKHTKACLLAAAAISASTCSAETNTGDRVIQLGKDFYNGTTKVQFTTEALGEADFFKIDPGPNATTFDSYVIRPYVQLAFLTPCCHTSCM